MTWQHGILTGSELVENTTENRALGAAFITAMEAWNIPEIDRSWSSTLPIRITIKGSDDPAFEEMGILTCKVTDQNKEPVNQARVIMQGKGTLKDLSDTLYTNREGIFIQTLIQPGKWNLNCYKSGFETSIQEDLEILKGSHSKQHLILKMKE
jgi:hypothetical protein